jgi:hypothetical protein
MFHDGALVAGQHLYMYLRQDDGTWWRIQDHQASKVRHDSWGYDSDMTCADTAGRLCDHRERPHWLVHGRRAVHTVSSALGR